MATLEQISRSLYRRVSGLAGTQQPVNSYVWCRESRIFLVDPAADLTPQEVQSSGLGAAGDILVTHMQSENVAGCPNFPGAKIHVPAGDEYLCRGIQEYEKVIEKWQAPWDWESRGNFHGNLAGAKNERPAANPLSLDRSLAEGDSVDGMRVLRTPGHGKNAVTLVAEIDGKRVGFCGDLVCGDGQLWNWFDCDWDYGLQGGQRALLESVKRLQQEGLDLLCPTHGPVITTPGRALSLLRERLENLLAPQQPLDTRPINFPEQESPAPGFRVLLPSLHQYCREPGNCNVLVSKTGNALMVDDGLCHWVPLPERAEHHRQVVADLKRALGIRKIQVVIPTHYHGDHIENIPELVELEGAEVVSLDLVADVIEQPERFNLCCRLPWYDTRHDTVRAHRRMRSGERLRWHEYELEFFHLGGQTYYHTGVDVTVDGKRILFVGDATHNAGGGCDAVLCYNKAEPRTAGWLYAIERMLERNPDLLVCGHASAIRDPLPRLQLQREAWKRRLKEFEALSARKDLREFFDPLLDW